MASKVIPRPLLMLMIVLLISLGVLMVLSAFFTREGYVDPPFACAGQHPSIYPFTMDTPVYEHEKHVPYRYAGPVSEYPPYENPM